MPKAKLPILVIAPKDKKGARFYIADCDSSGRVLSYVGEGFDARVQNFPGGIPFNCAVCHELRAFGVQQEPRTKRFYFDTRAEGEKALKIAKRNAKVLTKKPPAWAQKALAEGWKPPKGWRP